MRSEGDVGCVADLASKMKRGVITAGMATTLKGKIGRFLISFAVALSSSSALQKSLQRSFLLHRPCPAAPGLEQVTLLERSGLMVEQGLKATARR